jgi:hypothetical protein
MKEHVMSDALCMATSQHYDKDMNDRFPHGK